MRPRILPIALGAGIISVACYGGHATGARGSGCYDVTMGEYIPAVGDDKQYFTPPPTFRLSVDTASPATYIASPPMFENGPTGRWRVRNDSIEIAWSDGTTGVLLTGIVRSDSIIGTARPISDIVVPRHMQPTAKFAARKTECRPLKT